MNNTSPTVAEGPTRYDVRTGGLHWCAERYDRGRMDAPGSPDPWPPERFPLMAYYTSELKILARRMLNWDPDHRPTLLAARNTMETFFATNPGVRDDRNMGPVTVMEDDEFVIGQPYTGRSYD